MIKNLLNSKSLLQHLLIAFITATFFSAFIYLEYYGFTIKVLNTFFAISALGLFLYIPKRAILIAGGFIGLMWFYWISYSFEYYGVGWMMPIIILTFIVIYMLFFGVLALTNEVYIRAILLFALSFFEPFDWNWLQIELIFVESYIGVFKYQLALVLLALALPSYMKKSFQYMPLLFIVLAFNFTKPVQVEAPLKIKLIETNIKQEEKWQQNLLLPQIKDNILNIRQAISEGYDLVVLPESCFPIFLEQNPMVFDALIELSQDISIIVGSLQTENAHNYNVTYFFQSGKVEVAKKMVLVPFGEYIPLPKFVQKFINNTFFAGLADFVAAEKPTDFIIKGIKFRNAICYEATTQEIYAGDVKYLIAISNNAWFKASIEPTIQNLLLRYYARKNDVVIYHSVNWKGTGMVK